MSIQDQTIGKIRQMPESLVQEVSDFIDFLLMKHSGKNWELWLQFRESLEIAESDFSGASQMCKNLDSPHPLTPSPKDGRRGTRIMSPLSHLWERGWGEGKDLSKIGMLPIFLTIYLI